LVLVVDDEPLITQTLSAILNANGFAVLTALDAAEALDLCALIPPELLITDVSMPVKNGFDLAIEVKHAIPDCEVIFFSGHLGLAEMCAEMGELGKDCVMLVKPVHPADLLARVYEVMKRRGHALQSVSQARSQSLYEFLSEAVRGCEVNGSSWSLTFRARQRTVASAATAGLHAAG
jgi:DNA-binding response OmpR family regulator